MLLMSSLIRYVMRNTLMCQNSSYVLLLVKRTNTNNVVNNLATNMGAIFRLDVVLALRRLAHLKRKTTA